MLLLMLPAQRSILSTFISVNKPVYCSSACRYTLHEAGTMDVARQCGSMTV
jgi:hypothetical protein